MLARDQYELECALVKDALSNEVVFESGRVRAMDVSDCPDLKPRIFLALDTCEDCMDDLEHEMLMQELNQYAS